MGQGGHITLVNGTPYDWTRTYQHSYQMDSWDFPTTIPAGTASTVYVEWCQGIFKNTGDDAGEATYSLAGTDQSFQVQARGSGGFDLRVELTNLATAGHAKGSVIDLGWSWNGYVQFVLAGKTGAFISTNPPQDWMQSSIAALGPRTLRHLCMPGSHDAGMSTFTSGTAFAYRCNTQTQSAGIKEQLQLGARLFDIRPVISAGQYYTGHYGEISQINSWQGANGQSIQSIVDDVNAFTAANKELVVLWLSHDLNTDVGNASYRSFTQQEWNGLLAALKGLNHLYVAANPTTVDLTTLTLNDYIGGGKPAVIVVAELGSGITLGDYGSQGFYSSSQFPLYNDYANSNDLSVMSADQLSKMKAQRPNPDAKPFLLSWTLTQNGTQASTCVLHTANSILDLAAVANPALYTTVLQACTAQCYPNVLYIDNVATGNIAAMAMAVNTKAGA